MQLVDDLSYAKTYYPTSRVTKYINALASKIYLGIYQNRKEEGSRFLRFWKYDVPLTVYKHWRIMLFSAFIFTPKNKQHSAESQKCHNRHQP